MYVPSYNLLSLANCLFLCNLHCVCSWVHLQNISLFQDIFPHIPAKYFITATKEAH